VDEKRHTKTTVVGTKVDIREALTEGVLMPEEERIVRMRYGISENKSTKLELCGQEDPETRAKLAMIEQQALEAMSRAPRHARPVSVRKMGDRKQSIIERLRRED
jgi:DNA-directed RNA polymerase sigma subunit (sigma70/sigma32)